MRLRNCLTIFLAIFSFLFSYSAPTLAGLNPLVTATDTTAADVKYSTYSSGNWAAAAEAVSGEFYWQVIKSGNRNTKKVWVGVKASDTHLYASFWDGSGWKKGDGTSGADDLGAVYTSTYRCFDAAYEQTSGHVLVVAGDTSANNIKYWHYNGSTWDINGSTYTITTFQDSGYSFSIRWVRLASKPNSCNGCSGTNEIALVVAGYDASSVNRAVGIIWSGSSWGDESGMLNPSLGLPKASTTDVVGVEYMQASTNGGSALVTVGQTAGAEAWVWDGASWSDIGWCGVSTQIAWYHSNVKADPNSDDAMLIFWWRYNSSNRGVYVCRWDGSAWVSSTADTISTATPYGDYRYNRPFDVIFENGDGHSGHAVAVYSTTADTYFKHFDGGNWGSETPVYSSAVTNYWVQLDKAWADDDTIHLAMHDSADNLELYTWDNSSGSFTLENASLVSNMETAGSHGRQAFALSAGQSPTAVEMEWFRARQYGDDVLLEWRTGFEVDNLGFHLYREENGERIRINLELIAGSALLVGQGRMTAGYSYSWLDRLESPPPAGASGLRTQHSALSTQSPPPSPSPLKGEGKSARYWLEDIDAKGKRTWHGPISSTLSNEPLPPKSQAILLSHLSRRESRHEPSAAKAKTLEGRFRKALLKGKMQGAASNLRTGTQSL